MEGLEVFLFPLSGMLVHRRVILQRGTVRVKFLDQEQNNVLARGLKALYPEMSTLARRPPFLHCKSAMCYFNLKYHTMLIITKDKDLINCISSNDLGFKGVI